MSDMKEHVKGKVVFIYYKNNELWYLTESGFKFPVPISDIGDATFMAADKALLFMRWIRKHLETIKNAKEEEST